MTMTRRTCVISVALGAMSCHAAAQPQSRRSAHEFTFEALEGPPIRLADLAGRAILVVNTASRCGFTPQYRDLQALWRSHGPRGLTVIGVPSNDFGGQEPGGAQEIAAFCGAEYGVTFPMSGKQVVRGPDAHPFFRWAARESGAAVPRWNFHKILLDRQGRFVAAFESAVKPRDPKVLAAIEKVLSEPAN
jgi:glutathione peroxidase